MLFRALLILTLVFGVTACSTGNEKSDIGEVRVDEREDITGNSMESGPSAETSGVEGETLGYLTEDGPAPGTQQDLVRNVGDRVFFGYDRFDLTPEAQQTLQIQAEWLGKYPDIVVTIEGHCDERGTREYNLALGEKRAAAVKNYLVALGVDGSRITTISYGKERPAVLGSNSDSWALNRRGVTVVE